MAAHASIRERFNAFVRQGWPSFVLLLALTTSLALSVEKAAWVKYDHTISLMVFEGLAVGSLLAASRWKGSQAALYSLGLSLLVACQAVGRLIPPLERLFEQPFLAELEAARLRAFAFGLRAEGWVQNLQAGKPVDDTGLFVLLFAFLGWNCLVWLTWWALRRGNPLAGLIPVSVLMAVNVHLSRQAAMTLVFYLFLALLLAARGTFTAHRRGWTERGVDYAEDLGWDWGSGAALGAVAVAAFALFYSWIGTPEGWRAFSEMVERSRQRMADTAEQLFGGVSTPIPSENDIQRRPTVKLPDLREIGSPLPQGSETVLRVWISDPPPLPEGRGGDPTIAARKHYWRSRVFEQYTGRGWEAALDAGAIAAQPEELPGRYRLEQRYELLAFSFGALFAVNQPVSASEGALLQAVGGDASLVAVGVASNYQVVSLATDVTVTQMQSAGEIYPQAVLQAGLQLPESLPERVRSLAREVAGEGTPYEKSVRIQDYLRANYRYDLNVRPPSEGKDVVDEFLFDGRAGFCSHFASAMAVMLRAAGVPARVTAGYAMGSFSPSLMQYIVPASASHAWVEVYFPGYGWVEFEPTPAYSVFTYPEGAQAQPGTGGPAPAPQAEAGAGLSPVVWIGAPLGLVAVLWAAFFWVRSRRLKPAQAGALAEQAYLQARRELAWAGLAAAPSQTPLEYLHASLAGLEGYPRLADSLRRLTAAYLQAVYRAVPPDYGDVRMGQWAWRQAGWERARLILREKLFVGRK